jgi:hypothetical protein
MSLNFHSRNCISWCNCSWNLCRNFYATKAIKTFSLKKRHPPPPCRFAWKFQGRLKKFHCFLVILIIHAFEKVSQVFKITKTTMQVDKICSRILWTWPALAHLPWLILQPLVASTIIFYESSHKPIALLGEHTLREKLSWTCAKKFLNNWQIHSPGYSCY